MKLGGLSKRPGGQQCRWRWRWRTIMTWTAYRSQWKFHLVETGKLSKVSGRAVTWPGLHLNMFTLAIVLSRSTALLIPAVSLSCKFHFGQQCAAKHLKTALRVGRSAYWFPCVNAPNPWSSRFQAAGMTHWLRSCEQLTHNIAHRTQRHWDMEFCKAHWEC